jgi:hypothetical protein
MTRITTTSQKKNTTIPGMTYPATLLDLATASSYPAPPGLSATGRGAERRGRVVSQPYPLIHPAVPGCSRGAGVTADAARRAAARTVPGVVCPYPHLAGVVCPSPRYPAGMTAATITFCAP